MAASIEDMDVIAATPVVQSKKEVKLRRLPICMKWKICKRALEQIVSPPPLEAGDNPKKDKTKKSLFSRYCHVEFNLPKMFRGQRDAYGLSIYPNGKDESTKGQVWLSMHMTFTSDDWNRKCKFTVTIPSNGYSKTFEHEYYYGEKLDGELWEHNLCTTEELFNDENKYFESGWMIINVDGSYEDETDDEYYISAREECKELWKDDSGKDFTVIVGDKEIKAHKHVLAKQSSIFETAESKLEINDFAFETVETGIKHCYGFSFSGSLEDVISLYQFTEKYGMKDISTSIDCSLTYDVSLSTVCELANASFNNNMSILYDKCCRYLSRCMKKTVSVLNLDILDSRISNKLFNDAFRQYRCSPEDEDFDSLASEKSEDYDDDMDSDEEGGGRAGDGCRQM